MRSKARMQKDRQSERKEERGAGKKNATHFAFCIGTYLMILKYGASRQSTRGTEQHHPDPLITIMTADAVHPSTTLTHPPQTTTLSSKTPHDASILLFIFTFFFLSFLNSTFRFLKKMYVIQLSTPNNPQTPFLLSRGSTSPVLAPKMDV